MKKELPAKGFHSPSRGGSETTAEDVTDYLLLKNQEYYKSCSPQELAEFQGVLETNPAVRKAAVRREEVPEEGRGVFDQQLL